MSEKMKNLVPAAAMSLALVGLSGMKAYAADAEIVPTPSPDTTEPPTESQEQSAVTQSSADINSASKGEVTDGENGEKKNTLTVNADEGGNNGTLDVTTTPGGTTTETTDPVTSTTTNTTENPDGSTDTTTTTTTTSTTTTTEETNTEVKGEIKGDEVTTEPTDEEKDDLKEELGDALDKEVDDGQADPDPDPSATPGQPGETDPQKPHLEDLKQGDTIGENKEFTVTGTTGTSETTTNEQGQNVTTTTTTVTFEKVVEGTPTEGAGLTQEEFGKIVDKQFGLDGVEFTTNENGVISYVDPATDATVTVRLVQNTGTSTTNTTYTIEVSQTKTVVEEKKEEGTTNVGGSEEKPDGTTVYDPVEEGKDDPAVVDRFIDTVLNAANNGTKLNGAIPMKVENDDGSITVTAGDRRYDITTTETGLTADQIASVSNEHLVQLLGDGYVLSEDGQKILTADGGYEVDVTTDALTGKAIMRTIKVTDLKDPGNEEMSDNKDQATSDADLKKNAAANAAETAATEQGLQTGGTWSETTLNNDGTYTRTYTVGGKTYTFTMTADAEIISSSTDWTDKVKDPTHSSEQTTTNTGNASVTGETIVWSGTKTDEKITVTEDETTGEVSFEVNAVVGGQFDGAAVKSITPNPDGSITVITEQNGTNAEGKPTVTTKTYTFTLGTMSEEEKIAFMRDNGLAEGDATLTGLSKVTWTIDEKVTTTTPAVDEVSTPDHSKNNVTSESVSLPEGVSKNTDGTYTYNGVTLTKGEDGKWHGVSEDKKTTYTIEESTKTLTEIEIKNLIEKSETNPNGYEVPDGFTFTKVEGGKAIYTNAETKQTIAIDITTTGTNVTLKIDVKDQIESTVSEADVNAQIRAWVKDQVDKYGEVTVGDVTITQDTFEQKIGEIVKKIVVNPTVRFDKMTPTEIADMLDKLEQQSKDKYWVDDGSTYWVQTSYGNFTDKNGKAHPEKRNGKIENVDGVYYRITNNGQGEYWQQCDEKGNVQPGATKYDWNYARNAIKLPRPAKYQDGYNSKLGHIDLSAETQVEIDGQKVNCVIAKGVEVTIGKSAEDVANGNGERVELVTWLNQDGGETYLQYKRKPGIDPSTGNKLYQVENAINKANKFYKVHGTVAYGDYVERAQGDFQNDAEAEAWMTEKGYKAYVVIDKKYRFYKETAELITYGYLGGENNACDDQYDIKLGNLKMVDGEVTSINEKVDVWSSDVSATKVDSGWLYQLVFGDIVTKTPGTPADILIVDKDQVTDSGLAGKWTITQTKDKTDLKEEKQDGTEVWKYQGSDSTSYDSYKTWVAEEMGSFTATSTEYKGTLGTEYTKPGSITYDDLQVGKNAAGEDSVTKTLQTVRDLVASLQSTSVQRTTNSNTTTNTEHQAPREDPPEVDIPEEDPPLVDTPDEDPPEVDVPDEEPPVVDAPDEEPPLVDVPDEEPPVVDMPEEEPPVVDIPDEAPPMVDMPVEAPPVVDVADPVVPLADVPQTGDNVMLRVAAAITGLFSTLGLAVLTQKKREDEAN